MCLARLGIVPAPACLHVWCSTTSASLTHNSHIDYLFVAPSQMTFGLTKGGKLLNVIMQNII